MPETTNSNVRDATDEELEVGNPPYFYSPYPKRLALVHEPETQGEQDIVALVRKHWPEDIATLEELSQDEFDEGYSGTFIRNVLRSHFIPQDMMEEGDVEVPEAEALGTAVESEGGEWRIFRMGLRAALESEVTEDEGFDAFASGFVEGRKLKEELTPREENEVPA